MARLDRDPSAEGPLVQGFRDGGFSIDGIVHRAAFLSPVAAWAWSPPAVAELTPDDVEPILSLEPEPEFVLLGTGPGIAFPPRAFVRALEARGIGVEVMDSRAAARTWGVLRAEGRWIVAALMPLA